MSQNTPFGVMHGINPASRLAMRSICCEMLTTPPHPAVAKQSMASAPWSLKGNLCMQVQKFRSTCQNGDQATCKVLWLAKYSRAGLHTMRFFGLTSPRRNCSGFLTSYSKQMHRSSNQSMRYRGQSVAYQAYRQHRPDMPASKAFMCSQCFFNHFGLDCLGLRGMVAEALGVRGMVAEALGGIPRSHPCAVDRPFGQIKIISAVTSFLRSFFAAVLDVAQVLAILWKHEVWPRLCVSWMKVPRLNARSKTQCWWFMGSKIPTSPYSPMMK